MNKVPQRRYMKEFRMEAGQKVEKVVFSGYGVARRLSLSKSPIGNLIRALSQGKLLENGQNVHPQKDF